MSAPPTPWANRDMAGVYVELEHPADLLLEIRGGSLAQLMQHALYAFYDQTVDLAQVRPTIAAHFEVAAPDAAEVLRRLLTEALYLFSTEGFLAASASVHVAGPHDQLEDGIAAPGDEAVAPGEAAFRVRAVLWGEPADRGRHSLLAEIKAVTYHRLEAGRDARGWWATVLFDV